MRKKTHEEFVEELRMKKPTIEVIGKYINIDAKVEVRCKMCQRVWMGRPADLLSADSFGCVKCSAKKAASAKKKTNAQFQKEVQELNSDIEVLSGYTNNHTKVKLRCKTCGNEWMSAPNSLLSNRSGCPICSAKKSVKNRTKTHDVFIGELYAINPNIEVLGEYLNCSTKIECRCKICNHIWSTAPNYLVGKNPTGCPNCNASKGESRIKGFLDLNGIDYIGQKTFPLLVGTGGGLLSYDFYIPSRNLLIEYQGAFHDGSIKTGYQTKEKLSKQQEHDKRKHDFALKQDINLLEIWYWDFDNIEQILKDKLHINNIEKSA